MLYGSVISISITSRPCPFLSERVQLRKHSRERAASNLRPHRLRPILHAIDQAKRLPLLNNRSVELLEVGAPEGFELLPELAASTFSTPHTKESLAIRLKDKSGCVLVYTSDTGYSDELAAFAEGARLLLMECSFRENKPVKTLKPADAMKLVNKCQPEKVVLTHLYYEWDGIDPAEEARSRWTGETIEAVDGLRIKF